MKAQSVGPVVTVTTGNDPKPTGKSVSSDDLTIVLLTLLQMV